MNRQLLAASRRSEPCRCALLLIVAEAHTHRGSQTGPRTLTSGSAADIFFTFAVACSKGPQQLLPDIPIATSLHYHLISVCFLAGFTLAYSLSSSVWSFKLQEPPLAPSPGPQRKQDELGYAQRQRRQYVFCVALRVLRVLRMRTARLLTLLQASLLLRRQCIPARATTC